MEQQLINLGGFIGLLAYIIWQDWRNGRLEWRKKKEKNEDAGNVEELPAWASQLIQHFNHDTTEYQRQVLNRLDGIQECIKKANTKLDNIHEYGVKTRNERT